jgi:hypothetical protein
MALFLRSKLLCRILRLYVLIAGYVEARFRVGLSHKTNGSNPINR